uniref:Uncharacterized protein n=1 Tax=Rhizophora mucronata TaxID=61149 RepID=A0A2P2IUB7_RHIMU
MPKGELLLPILVLFPCDYATKHCNQWILLLISRNNFWIQF